MKAPENVVLLGDSITQGLGSKKINFTQELQDRLGPCFCVQNLALTGTTIRYPLEIVDESWFPHGGVCVILYGNVDAQIRPDREGKIFPKIPKRFQKSGMLMPRPFYSHNPVKKAVQHGENALRRFFSRLIIRVDGTEQWVNAEDFDNAYRELIGRLREKGFEIFCCSTVFIDEKLFEGTLKQYVIFNGLIHDAARGGAEFIDLFEPLREAVDAGGWASVYNKDHFHPNGRGYSHIAQVLADRILASCGQDAVVDESEPAA